MRSALPRRGVLLFDTLTAVRAFEDVLEDGLGRNQVRPVVVEFSLRLGTGQHHTAKGVAWRGVAMPCCGYSVLCRAITCRAMPCRDMPCRAVT